MQNQPVVLLGLATAYHAGVGSLLLLAPASSGSTGLHAVLSLLGGNKTLAGFCLLLAAAMALGGMVYKQAWPLVPQQMLFLAATVTVLTAVVSQSYPDGTERSWAFILGDQLLLLLVALAHTLSILLFHSPRGATWKSLFKQSW